MKSIINKNIKIVLIIFLTIFHIFIFKDVFFNIFSPIYYGDIAPYEINPLHFIYSYFFSWNELNGTGVTNTMNIPIILQSIFNLIWLKLWVSKIILNKIILLLYIFLLPYFTRTFFETLQKKIYWSELLLPIFLVSLFYINNFFVGQIFQYPLSYFYLPFLFFVIWGKFILENSFKSFIILLLVIFISIGYSQTFLILLWTYGVLLFLRFQYNWKSIIKELSWIIIVWWIFLLPFITFFIFRNNTKLNEELTQSAQNYKKDFPMYNLFRNQLGRFHGQYKTTIWWLHDRNFWIYYNTNIWLLISFLPFLIFIVLFFNINQNKEYKKYMLTMLAVYLLIIYNRHGWSIHPVIDELLRWTEKLFLPMLFVQCFVYLYIFQFFSKKIQYGILVLFLFYNIKSFYSLFIAEVYTNNSRNNNNEISKILSNKNTLYLPIVKWFPWTPISWSQLSYLYYPIQYNTKSFTANVGNINSDVFDAYWIFNKDDYSFNENYFQVLELILKKYNITHIVFLKNFWYNFFYLPNFENKIIQLLNKKLIKNYESNDIIIYNTNIHEKSVINVNWFFSKLNPTKYQISLTIPSTSTGEELRFLQSFHPERKLYPWKTFHCQTQTPETIITTEENTQQSWSIQRITHTMQSWDNNSSLAKLYGLDSKTISSLIENKSIGDRVILGYTGNLAQIRGYYSVGKNESLLDIAKRFRVYLDDLLTINHFEKDTILRSNDDIKIPFSPYINATTSGLRISDEAGVLWDTNILWITDSEDDQAYKSQECIHTGYTFFEGEELSYLWKKPLRDDHHSLVNDYANGRSLDLNQKTINDPSSETYLDQGLREGRIRTSPEGEAGESEWEQWSYQVDLVLYFRPQSRFYLGLAMSGITLLSLLWRLGRDWVRRRKTI
jgi:LysM repeat protein